MPLILHQLLTFECNIVTSLFVYHFNVHLLCNLTLCQHLMVNCLHTKRKVMRESVRWLLNIYVVRCMQRIYGRLARRTSFFIWEQYSQLMERHCLFFDWWLWCLTTHVWDCGRVWTSCSVWRWSMRPRFMTASFGGSVYLYFVALFQVVWSWLM